MTKTRIIVQLDGAYFAGKGAKIYLAKYSKKYLYEFVSKAKTSVERFKDIYAKLPITQKGLWIFREPKNISEKRSRYAQMCRTLGIGNGRIRRAGGTQGEGQRAVFARPQRGVAPRRNMAFAERLRAQGEMIGIPDAPIPQPTHGRLTVEFPRYAPLFPEEGLEDIIPNPLQGLTVTTRTVDEGTRAINEAYNFGPAEPEEYDEPSEPDTDDEQF